MARSRSQNHMESKWHHISKGIIESSQKRVLVKELIDGRDKLLQIEEDV
jgi:hypothetical protein